MGDAISQSLPINDQDERPAKTRTTSPGGNEEVQWEIVARMPGITPATILAGRLQAEGIPTRAWQEGAGRAIGLTVGILGTGYVAVPVEYAEKARQILADGEDGWEEESPVITGDEDIADGESK